MSKPKIDYVFDLGGSIVNPGELNAEFLQEFQGFISEYVGKGKSFGVVVGGGFLSRLYQDFLQKNFDVTDEDLDMVGIRPTMLNAELVRIVLKTYTYPCIIENPNEALRNAQHSRVFVFSGWKGKTGHTTDYVSVLVAKRFGIKEVLSLTNIRGVYPREGGVLQREKVISHLTWDEYMNMIDIRWTPGVKVPFDPIATQEAKHLGMKVVILQGTDLANVRRYLEAQDFVGTVIS